VIIREESTALSFDNFSNNALNILQQIYNRLAPPLFVGQLNIVRMLYPLSSEEAANQFLTRNFLSVPEGLEQRMGRPLAGIGLRLVYPPTREKPNEFQLRVEPFFRDQTQLYIENSGRFLPPFKKMEEAKSRLEQTYAFLKSSLEALI
jgi:hypothetical protein